ncbi:hypothetical protein ACPOL_0351 [Acidisarcina polymorpha]|uniref:Uncharacterized protein n=1 Tax=Acidisarcina polymorpha TaxID=2211140 RepID=A0A2Z5FSI7_9BACT|nr:hypothetical protein ACPOL_0351 [Acidisarcina polymorpha]
MEMQPYAGEILQRLMKLKTLLTNADRFAGLKAKRNHTVLDSGAA